MRIQEYGLAPRAQFAQHLTYLLPTKRIKAFGGLVEKKQVRVIEQSMRKTEPLLHALRESADELCLRVGKPKFFQQFRNALLHRGGVDAIQLAHVAQE